MPAAVHPWGFMHTRNSQDLTLYTVHPLETEFKSVRIPPRTLPDTLDPRLEIQDIPRETRNVKSTLPAKSPQPLDANPATRNQSLLKDSHALDAQGQAPRRCTPLTATHCPLIWLMEPTRRCGNQHLELQQRGAASRAPATELC